VRSGAELALGTVATATALAVSAIGALFPFLVARLLGQAALGAYALAWSTADLLSKVGVFGLDQTTVALAARRRALGDVAGLRRLHADALRIGLLSSLALALVATAVVGFAGPRLGQPPEIVRAQQLMLVALPGVALYRISNGVSRGLGFMRHDIASGGFVENATTVLALLVLVALGAAETAPVIAATCGFTAGGTVAFLLARHGLAQVRHADERPSTTPSSPALAAPTAPERHLVRYSATVAAYSLLNLLVNKLDLLLLGWFVGRAPGVTAATLGVYAAAGEIAGLTRKVRQALEPALTAAVASETVRDLTLARETLGRAARWTLALLLPLLGVLVLAPALLLRLFGPGFESGATWLAVLAVAHGLGAFVGLAETVLLVRRPSWNLANSAVAVALQATVAIVLVPRLGPLGAALGTLAAVASLAALRSVQLARVGLGWPLRAMGRPVAAFAMAALVASVVRVAWSPAAAAPTLLVAYVAAWAVVGLAPEDRAILRLGWGRVRRT
jgi:O-antigen/teichoic acid export membrane protein